MKANIIFCVALIHCVDALFGAKKGKNSTELREDCQNKTEGLQWLTNGVDITQFDLFHFVPVASDGFRDSVIDFSCEEQKKWTSFYTGITHDIPDQIWSIGNIPGDLMNPHVRVVESPKDAKRYMAELMGIELVPGMFSNAETYDIMSNKILDNANRNVIVDISAPISSTEVVLSPSYSLKPGSKLAESFKKLPKRFNDNRNEFKTFIETFGTHFLTLVGFGPFLRNQITMPRSFFKERGDAYVIAQSKKVFRNWIRKAVSSNEKLESIDPDFGANAVVSKIVYGGQSVEFAERGFSTWIKNALETSFLFSGKLLPIYEIVAESDKRESLKEAIEAHLDQASLNDMEKQLGKLSNYYSKEGMSGKVHELIDGVRYTKAVDSQLLDHELISTLVNHVDFHVELPDWWKDIRLCFTFQNEISDVGDNKQCLRKTPECAEANRYTGLLQGGCKLSWGVFAITDSADWFQNVQLCVNYSGSRIQNEGDHNIPTGENCSPINTHSYYLDITKGGTELPWMLKVIDDGSIPAWFLNSKLCYRYTEHRRMRRPKIITECALVNNYTSTRWDKTRFKRSMYVAQDFIQWGIFD